MTNAMQVIQAAEAATTPAQRDARIMALCDQAIVDLQEARTIEEVRRVGDLASAFAAYTRKIKAALEAQNTTQKVVLLAEARIGAELKAAQERGEVARKNEPVSQYVRTSDILPATLSDLGITRQRAHEMKRLADVGPAAIEEAAQAANEAGERLTRDAVFNHRAQGTGENEWYTPAEHIEAAREVLGEIDLDPASSIIANKTVRAAQFFTIEDNGLEREWHGRVWINPPYAQPHILHFAQKIAKEYIEGRTVEAIALTHNYTDTAWFHLLGTYAAAICFTRGRIGFLSPEGQKAAPTQGQAFFYFGPDPAKFSQVFTRFGLVMRRHGV
jgi:phage N-6-adenine-methyltransferase